MDKKLFFGIAGILIILFWGLTFNKELRKHISGNGMDVWEYQTIAVNMALFNQFPVMGFLDAEEKYQTNTLEYNPVEDYFKCRFEQQGPVTYVGKPPLYSLALGITYKLFQPDMKFAYYLNLFFFTGILFSILLIAYYSDKKYGIALALIAALGYIFFGKHGLSDILPATMLSFVICCIALSGILLLKTFSVKYFITAGIFLAIGMLVKGNIIFIVFFTPIFLAYMLFHYTKKYSGILIMLFAFAIVLLPWVIYANYVRIENTEKWSEWKQKIIKAESACFLDTVNIKNWGRRANRKQIVENNEHHKIVSHIYSRTANENIPIIISNQATSDEMLSVHSDLNLDGDWHPEWRFRPDAVYNRMYLDKPFLLKIFSYYIDNPSMIFRIALAKLARSTSFRFSFFLFAAFLFGLYVWNTKINSEKIHIKRMFLFISCLVFFISFFFAPQFHIVYSTLFFFTSLAVYRQMQMNEVHFIFPVSILNCFLTVFVFYGDARFINVIDPLSIFLSIYILFHFIKDYFFSPLKIRIERW